METSILDSIKKMLGVDPTNLDFDDAIITHINSTFSTLKQLGVGPVDGFQIEDKDAEWDAFLDGNIAQNSVKSYMYAKVRLIFDAPTTSYLKDSLVEIIREYEWRISTEREEVEWVPATAV